MRGAVEVVVHSPGPAPLFLATPRGTQASTFFPGDERCRVEVGADGSFRIEDLPPGTYILSAVSGWSSAERVVHLYRDEEDCELVLGSCWLRGQIHGPILHKARALVIGHWDGRTATEISVDPDGRFELGPLRPGPVVLSLIARFPPDDEWRILWGDYVIDVHAPETNWEVRADTYTVQSIDVRAPSPGRGLFGRLIVEVNGGMTLDHGFHLSARGTIHDIKLNLDGNRKMAADPERESTTISDLPLPLGTHIFRVEMPGYQPFTKRLTVDGKEPLTLHLKLAEGRWIQVRCAAKHWLLEARLAGAPWKRVLHEDTTLHWRWAAHAPPLHLEKGPYEFRLHSSDHALHTWGPVAIDASNATLMLRPALSKGVSLSGPIVAPVPTALEDQTLSLKRREPSGVWTRLWLKEATVTKQHYAFEGLAPGTYRVVPVEAQAVVLAEVEVRSTPVEQAIVLSNERGAR